MSYYISREQLKKRFCTHCESYDVSTGCTEKECFDLQIIDSIPAADVVERKQWIPVTERLPEHNGDYLVYSVGGNWKQLACIEIAFWDDKRFITNSFFVPTRWMPLPEPPESEGE